MYLNLWWDKLTITFNKDTKGFQNKIAKLRNIQNQMKKILMFRDSQNILQNFGHHQYTSNEDFIFIKLYLL